MENVMKKIVTTILASLLLVSLNTLAAPADAASCEAKAVSKAGKPLAGAAKTAFIKKCEGGASDDTAKTACEAKAVSKEEKPLAGAAKAASVKKCLKG
jgi:hypothetical protein